MLSVVLPLSLRLGLMQPTGFPWPWGSHWVLPRGLMQPETAAQMRRLEPLAVLSRPLAGAAGGPRGLMQPLAVPEAGSNPK